MLPKILKTLESKQQVSMVKISNNMLKSFFHKKHYKVGVRILQIWFGKFKRVLKVFIQYRPVFKINRSSYLTLVWNIISNDAL